MAADDAGIVPRRTRVAVALGGGGARGYAHIGVLEVLEERGYDIVSIAGSSMGAVVGGVYATDGLEAFSAWVCGLTHRDVLRMYDLAPSAPGAIRAEKIFAKVSDILGDARIEDLPLEFTAVATDLEAGEERWFQEGSVVAAVRASAALPGFMTPVVMRGRLLADGGLLNPVPIAPTVTAGADLTVAVAVSGTHRTSADAPAAPARPRGVYRSDALRRTATQVLDSDVLRGLGTRLAALRAAPPGRTHRRRCRGGDGGGVRSAPAGLRTLDVMELALDAVRTRGRAAHACRASARRAHHDPQVVLPDPRFPQGQGHDRARRRLAVEALDSAGGPIAELCSRRSSVGWPGALSAPDPGL